MIQVVLELLLPGHGLVSLRGDELEVGALFEVGELLLAELLLQVLDLLLWVVAAAAERQRTDRDGDDEQDLEDREVGVFDDVGQLLAFRLRLGAIPLSLVLARLFLQRSPNKRE